MVDSPVEESLGSNPGHAALDPTDPVAMGVPADRFLYEIQNKSMAVRLESVELTSRDKEGKQLALTVQLSGLVLSSQVQLTR